MRRMPFKYLLAAAAAMAVNPDPEMRRQYQPHGSRGPVGRCVARPGLRHSTSKYQPHQGAAECARRRRQMGMEP